MLRLSDQNWTGVQKKLRKTKIVVWCKSECLHGNEKHGKDRYSYRNGHGRYGSGGNAYSEVWNGRDRQEHDRGKYGKQGNGTEEHGRYTRKNITELNNIVHRGVWQRGA